MLSYKKASRLPAEVGAPLTFGFLMIGAAAARGTTDQADRGHAGMQDGLRFVGPWPRLKLLVKSGLTLAFGLVLGGCAGLSPQTMRWKEEVKLHDGRVIVAERFYNLGGYPGYDAHERVPLDETVTFHLPDGSSVVWKNDFRDSVPEPNSLNHFRFDLVDGVPYLATYPAGCIAYNKWGRPNPPQVLLKYTKGQWQRIALNEQPPLLINTEANVVVGRPATSLLKGFYTVQDVDAKNHNIKTPEYRTILPSSVQNAGGRCGEMVYDGKGGWIGIGWFRRQPNFEACQKLCVAEKIQDQYCPCDATFKER